MDILAIPLILLGWSFIFWWPPVAIVVCWKLLNMQGLASNPLARTAMTLVFCTSLLSPVQMGSQHGWPTPIVLAPLHLLSRLGPVIFRWDFLGVGAALFSAVIALYWLKRWKEFRETRDTEARDAADREDGRSE